MKILIVSGLMAFAGGLFSPQMAWSQSSFTYLSNLAQPSIGSAAVASDAWAAEDFITGNNPGGYALNSVQLSMAAAVGEPDDFTVMVYANGDLPNGALPGSSIGTLNGSSAPLTAGTYTYTGSGLHLSPSTDYFIVLTSATPMATGAFAYSVDNAYPSSTGGWGTAGTLVSDTGIAIPISWSPVSDYLQFAITASAVPEPNELFLLGVPGALFLAWYRRRGTCRFSFFGRFHASN